MKAAQQKRAGFRAFRERMRSRMPQTQQHTTCEIHVKDERGNKAVVHAENVDPLHTQGFEEFFKETPQEQKNQNRRVDSREPFKSVNRIDHKKPDPDRRRQRTDQTKQNVQSYKYEDLAKDNTRKRQPREKLELANADPNNFKYGYFTKEVNSAINEQVHNDQDNYTRDNLARKERQTRDLYTDNPTDFNWDQYKSKQKANEEDLDNADPSNFRWRDRLHKNRQKEKNLADLDPNNFNWTDFESTRPQSYQNEDTEAPKQFTAPQHPKYQRNQQFDLRHNPTQTESHQAVNRDGLTLAERRFQDIQVQSTHPQNVWPDEVLNPEEQQYGYQNPDIGHRGRFYAEDSNPIVYPQDNGMNRGHGMNPAFANFGPTHQTPQQYPHESNMRHGHPNFQQQKIMSDFDGNGHKVMQNRPRTKVRPPREAQYQSEKNYQFIDERALPRTDHIERDSEGLIFIDPITSKPFNAANTQGGHKEKHQREHNVLLVNPETFKPMTVKVKDKDARRKDRRRRRRKEQQRRERKKQEEKRFQMEQKHQHNMQQQVHDQFLYQEPLPHKNVPSYNHASPNVMYRGAPADVGAHYQGTRQNHCAQNGPGFGALPKHGQNHIPENNPGAPQYHQPTGPGFMQHVPNVKPQNKYRNMNQADNHMAYTVEIDSEQDKLFNIHGPRNTPIDIYTKPKEVHADAVWPQKHQRQQNDHRAIFNKYLNDPISETNRRRRQRGEMSPPADMNINHGIRNNIHDQFATQLEELERQRILNRATEGYEDQHDKETWKGNDFYAHYPHDQTHGVMSDRNGVDLFNVGHKKNNIEARKCGFANMNQTESDVPLNQGFTKPRQFQYNQPDELLRKNPYNPKNQNTVQRNHHNGTQRDFGGRRDHEDDMKKNFDKYGRPIEHLTRKSDQKNKRRDNINQGENFGTRAQHLDNRGERDTKWNRHSGDHQNGRDQRGTAQKQRGFKDYFPDSRTVHHERNTDTGRNQITHRGQRGHGGYFNKGYKDAFYNNESDGEDPSRRNRIKENAKIRSDGRTRNQTGSGRLTTADILSSKSPSRESNRRRPSSSNQRAQRRSGSAGGRLDLPQRSGGGRSDPPAERKNSGFLGIGNLMSYLNMGD